MHQDRCQGSPTSAQPLTVVCGVLQDPEGRYLAAQRASGKSLGGKWEFPGGKLHSDETPEQALVREFREELAVEIRVLTALPPVDHAYPNFSIRLLPFRAEIISGSLEAKEHAALRWFSPGEWKSLDWAAADIPIVRNLCEPRRAGYWELGLRQGDAAFFAPTAEQAEILTERRVCLSTAPARYAAAVPEARPWVEEVLEFAAEFCAAPSLSREQPPADLCAALGRIWEPDWVVLGNDLRLMAGCVCFPSHWALPQKLGLSIEETHGPVPELNPEIGGKIRAFLERLKAGTAWERWNWGLAATPRRDLHPATQPPRLQLGLSLEQIWLRLEHQTFVRLPSTKGVLFGIRIHCQSLASLCETCPGDASQLAQKLAAMPESIAAYKGLAASKVEIVNLLQQRCPSHSE